MAHCRVSLKIQSKQAKSTPLTYDLYMAAHFPGLVQSELVTVA